MVYENLSVASPSSSLALATANLAIITSVSNTIVLRVSHDLNLYGTPSLCILINICVISGNIFQMHSPGAGQVGRVPAAVGNPRSDVISMKPD